MERSSWARRANFAVGPKRVSPLACRIFFTSFCSKKQKPPPPPPPKRYTVVHGGAWCTVVHGHPHDLPPDLPHHLPHVLPLISLTIFPMFSPMMSTAHGTSSPCGHKPFAHVIFPYDRLLLAARAPRPRRYCNEMMHRRRSGSNTGPAGVDGSPAALYILTPRGLAILMPQLRHPHPPTLRHHVLCRLSGDERHGQRDDLH